MGGNKLMVGLTVALFLVLASSTVQIASAQIYPVTMNVYNVKGLNLPQGGGTIHIWIFDEQWRQVKSVNKTFWRRRDLRLHPV